MKQEITSALSKQGDAKTAELCKLMKEFTMKGDVPGVSEICSSCISDNAPDFNLAQARSILQAQLDGIEDFPCALCVDESLRAIQTRYVPFEEQDVLLRDKYADMLISKAEDYTRAAKVLMLIPFQSTRFTDLERAERYVRIAELFLEDGQSVDAETFVNRASLLMESVKDAAVLQTRFHVCYARTLDAKCKFVEASTRYYQLSLPNPLMEVEEGDLNVLLCKAIVCALLGNAGPNRSRVLALLTKDARVASLQGGLFVDLVENMFLDRLISSSEVIARMTPFLERHQQATMADGTTFLQRAIVEHNVIAASKVYENIALTSLAQLLEMSADNAERVVSKMIIEGRLLKASIDQIDELVVFDGTNVNDVTEFDAQISRFCESMNTVVERITAKHPKLAPT